MDTLSLVLGHHSGDVQAAVAALLDSSAVAPDDGASADADMARRIQLDQDEEMAKAVQASLEEEARVAEERRKQADPIVQASKAVNSGVAQAKAFMQRVALGRKPPAEVHGARLLDAPLEISSDDFRPIANYAPPTVADLMNAAPQPPPPPVVNPAMVDVSDDAPPLMAPPAPQADAMTTNRYSSRVDRARSANRARVSSPPAPMMATLVPLDASSM